MQRFREQIAGTPHIWVDAATGAFFQNTPFHAVADMLRQSFHWGGDQAVEQRLAILEAALALAGIELNEAVPLVASLLELPLGDRYPRSPATPDQQRKRLLAALVSWTLGTAKVQPLVIATEDLRWADPSTLELIQLLVEQCATARLLLLYTARPEFRVHWSPRSHHTQITLTRLSSRDVRKMVEAVVADRSWSEDTITAIVERTSGVPLFVE